jgi:hypothetical protein
VQIFGYINTNITYTAKNEIPLYTCYAIYDTSVTIIAVNPLVPLQQLTIPWARTCSVHLELGGCRAKYDV